MKTKVESLKSTKQNGYWNRYSYYFLAFLNNNNNNKKAIYTVT